ncbi:MAG: nicotinamide riboside transporter PnuC [Salibacteraceae bacterium]
MGSAIGVFLFVWPDAEVKLYSEAVLYSYYVWIGVYGWIRWNKTETSQQIKNWGLKLHLIAFGCGAILAPALGYVMDRLFDSNNPYIDATTTVFSFIASYMQAERIYTSWHFWIVINLISVWLYWNRGLAMYSGLMIIYVGLSMLGLWQWRKLRATSQ